MRVAVVGLWHLGCVTAACLAHAGHDVVGVDFQDATIAGLREGRAPIHEPGLNEIVASGIAERHLSFTSEPSAVSGCDVVWITYDTPVDEDDRADVEWVVEQIERLFPHLAEDTLVVVSSQVPIGTTATLARRFAGQRPDARVGFAYSPENLRLGRAVEVFTRPERVVVGVRRDVDRPVVQELLRPFTDRIEWMSVESAEMTKHALNAFLATSVVFANELAALCEAAGADAKDVERGLKTDVRIGPRAYLSPGAAFAGGTLARDVLFLGALGARTKQPTRLLAAVRESNDLHKQWAERRLQQDLGELRDRRIAIWGLTYKPGTDTLRRSSAVELCRRLAARGAAVRAHDPAVRALPEELARCIDLVPSALEAVDAASALVVATEWPEYRLVEAGSVIQAMRDPYVLDAGRFLAGSLGADPRVRYATVGRGTA